MPGRTPRIARSPWVSWIQGRKRGLWKGRTTRPIGAYWNSRREWQKRTCRTSRSKGWKGDKGFVGAPGIRGETGTKGRQGQKGSIGLKGNKGIRGLVGIQGPKGECVVSLKIRVYPISHKVFINETAIFFCWVQGQTSSKITWHKLGGTLSDATVENGALRINSVQKSHVGSYMCSANTGIRSLRGFSTLQVKGMNISASFFWFFYDVYL